MSFVEGAYIMDVTANDEKDFWRPGTSPNEIPKWELGQKIT